MKQLFEQFDNEEYFAKDIYFQRLAPDFFPADNQNNFNQDNWKSLKNKIYSINFQNEEDTLPYIKIFYKLLYFLLSAESNHVQKLILEDNKNKKYFFEDIIPNSVKFFLMNRQYRLKEVSMLQDVILLNCLVLADKFLHEDNLKLNELFKKILDPNNSYFKLNSQDEYDNKPFGSEFQFVDNQEEWSNNLSVGDNVDVIKRERTNNLKTWSRARILEINGSQVRIRFFNESQNFNRYVGKNSLELAPFKSMSDEDFDWRLNLQIGDIVDVNDSANVWYNSTILEKRVSSSEEKGSDFDIIEVFIGFRIYDEEGLKVDQDGRRFNGWSSKYDEWISVTNPRIQKKNSLARKIYLQASNQHEEIVTDDQSDMLFQKENKRQKKYAITRGFQCRNTTLVTYLNILGESGFFDRILAKFQSTEPWCPIDSVSTILSALGNVHMLFFRNFAQDYIPKLKAAVFGNILNSPESNIRNFSKEKIESVVLAMDSLIKRVYSLGEKYELLEDFTLQTSLMCFKSNFLERKIQGLKQINDIIRNVKLGFYKFLTLDYLSQKLSSEHIFESLFDPATSHTQIISRCDSFLKFMIQENFMTLDHFEIIWNAVKKSDQETKLGIYKVLTDINTDLKIEQILFLIGKIKSEYSSEGTTSEEVKLVFEITRFSRNSQCLKEGCNYLWGLIHSVQNAQVLNSELIDICISKFCMLLRMNDMKEYREGVIDNCVKNLSQSTRGEQMVIASLKILTKIIESYPLKEFIKSNTDDYSSQQSIVLVLFQEKAIANTILNNIRLHRQDLVGNSENRQQVEQYIVQLNALLNFLKFLVGINNGDAQNETSVFLGFDFISELWSLIMTDPVHQQEQDKLFSWLYDYCEGKNVPIKQITRFFKEVMVQRDDQFRNMSMEGLSCYQSLFCAINYQEQRLVRTTTSVTSTNSFNKNYSMSNYYNEEKVMTQEITYTTLVQPEKLEGISVLWSIIFSSHDEPVVNKAIEFLNGLYLNLSDQMSDQVIDIRTQYLQRCMDSLNQFFVHREKYSAADFEQGVLKCIKLINSMLDESEKQGTSGLQSHSSLAKGDVITIIINNEATYGSDVPRKPEVKINSNKSVFDLKVQIAKAIKSSVVGIKLKRAGGEIRDIDNGRTLNELRFKNGEILIANSKPTPPVEQVPLVTPNKELVPAVKKIFTSWFETFSENGKMSPDGCANFIHSCTGDFCKGDDRRVKDVFAKYDTDNDGFLVLDDFLAFYKIACNERPYVVWNNLHGHHYRNDLKKIYEVEGNQASNGQPLESLPRYLLSQDEKNYNLLFNLLDFAGIENQVWSLINRIPTSPFAMQKIVSFEKDGDNNVNWEEILGSKSSFKLLYNLSIMEFLMENQTKRGGSDDEEEDPENIQKKNNEDLQKQSGNLVDLIKENKNWRSNFIEHNGFQRLFDIYDGVVSNQAYEKLSIVEKNILCFLLNIFKNYFTALFANKVPTIYTQAQIIRNIQFPLEIVSSIYKKEDQTSLNQLSFQRGASFNAKDQLEAKQNDKKLQLFQQKMSETDEFKQLVESLQVLGDKIRSTVKMVDLLKQMTDQLLSIIQFTLENNLEIEDRLLIENGLTIVVCSLLYSEECADCFFGEYAAHYKNLVIEGIFYYKDLNVRNYFNHALYVLSKKDARFKGFILKNLLENIPGSEEQQQRQECNQFYELLCQMLEECEYEVAQQTGVDYEKLMEKMIHNITNHRSTEKRNYPQNDKVLIGFLNLVEKLLELMPSLKQKFGYFVQDIFRQCLFVSTGANDEVSNLDDDSYVKCKAQDSRRSAYKVISSLIRTKDYSNLKVLLRDGLRPLSKNIPIPHSWNFTPAFDTKSHYGHVGLKNLGCICYMNSMLQQFYMCKQFRYALLMADDKQPENIVVKDNKFQIDDNVLHQLQKMFSYLESSDRQDYNPFEFCFSFKDYSGQPVNVSIQQDAQEFLNMIFDKLENGLKATPFQNLLTGVFGGKTSSQLICQSCGFKKSNDEPFYTLSVEVKNLKNIYESFDKYIQGETISDFFCENCQQKSDIVKRTCLSYLPNVLIIHMQRIIFDFDTLMNVKINSKLEFPEVLNLEPYTNEGLEAREKQKASEEGVQDEEAQVYSPEYYEYRLKGVVVHLGTADFGHYYSYIECEDGKWLEFNDSNIRDFDKKNIQTECFGGSSTDQGDDWGWGGQGMRDNSKNAYILVYERNYKVPLKLTIRNTEEFENIKQMVRVGDDALVGEPNEENPRIIEIDYYAIQKFIPDRVNKSVWRDNLKFMLEKHVYTTEFFSFINEVVDGFKLPPLSDHLFYPQYQELSQEQKEVIIQLLEILVQLNFQVLSHAHDNAIMELYTQKINQLLRYVPDYSMEFIQTNIISKYPQVQELWLSCPEKLARAALSKVFLQALNIAVQFYQLPLVVQEENPTDQKSKFNLILIGFLRKLISSIPFDVARNWNKFQHFFEFWSNFAQSGPAQTNFCFNHELIAVFIDFYLERKSPLYNYQDKSAQLGNRYAFPNFDPLLETVAVLLQKVQIEARLLTNNESLCLYSNEFYNKTYKEKHNPEALASIIEILSVNNEAFSNSIINIILKGLQFANLEESKIYLASIEKLLSIVDAYQVQRIELLLGFPQLQLNRNNSFAMVDSLQDQVVTYETFIPQTSSLLNIIFRNKKKYENMCILCLNKLLKIAVSSNIVFEYLIRIPSPCNQYLLYTDWMKPFILEYITDTQRYYASQFQGINRDELGKESLQLFESLEKKIQEYRENQNRYVIGKFVGERQISQEVIHEDPNTHEQIIFQEIESTVYITNQSDVQIPSSMLRFEFFVTEKIDPQSTILNFIHDKQEYVKQETNIQSYKQDSDNQIILHFNDKSNKIQNNNNNQNTDDIDFDAKNQQNDVNSDREDVMAVVSSEDDQDLQNQGNTDEPQDSAMNDLVQQMLGNNQFDDVKQQNKFQASQSYDEYQLDLDQFKQQSINIDNNNENNQNNNNIENNNNNDNINNNDNNDNNDNNKEVEQENGDSNNNKIKVDVREEQAVMFKRFLISNRTNNNIIVYLKVATSQQQQEQQQQKEQDQQQKQNYQQDQQQQLVFNTFLPSNLIQAQVRARQENAQLLVVSKINHKLPLPQLEYSVKAIIVENNLNMGGQSQQQEYFISNVKSGQNKFYSVEISD